MKYIKYKIKYEKYMKLYFLNCIARNINLFLDIKSNKLFYGNVVLSQRRKLFLISQAD